MDITLQSWAGISVNSWTPALEKTIELGSNYKVVPTEGYILNTTIKSKFGGRTELDEVGLKVSQTGEILPCGASSFYIGE